MNFGNDFNSSKPEDSAYVRHPSLSQLATELRNIKSRVVSFFGTCFNLTSDIIALKDNSMPFTALIDSSDKPSSGEQYFKEVTVNSKGFVVAGNFNPPPAKTSVYRAVFVKNKGYIEQKGTSAISDSIQIVDGQYVAGVSGVEGAGPYMNGYLYDFVVPEGIKRLFCRIIGGFSTDPSSNHVACGYPVSGGARLTVCCAASNGISFVAVGSQPDSTGLYAQYLVSNGNSRGFPVHPDPFGIDSFFRRGSSTSPYWPVAETPGQTPRPGMVILEWYA